MSPRRVRVLWAAVVVTVAAAIAVGVRAPSQAVVDSTGAPEAGIASRPRAEVAPPPVAPTRLSSASSAPAPIGPASAAPTPPRVEVVTGTAGGPSETVVRLRRDQVLALVNGLPITLAVLMPLDPSAAGGEVSLSPERYAFLLERAIDRELTYREAEARGVQLDEAQRLALEKLKRKADSRDPAAFDALGRSASSTEFEQRDMAALMLQSALAVKAGSPGPHVTSDLVEAYYRAHLTEYGELPVDPNERRATWQRFDSVIRAKLARDVEAEHERRVRELLDELRAQADLRR